MKYAKNANSKNIAIAGRSMNTPGGVKEYLEGLCYGLSQIDLPTDLNIFFFTTDDAPTPRYDSALTIVQQGKSNRFLWDHITLPRLLQKYTIDHVLHVKNTIPLTVKIPSTVVVHDLMHILQPEVYKTSDAIYMKMMMRKTLPRAEHIIAISENTKTDLLQCIPAVDEKNVSVIYQDAMPRFDEPVTELVKNELRKTLNLPEKFLLYTGSLSPRKNVEGLLKAFALIQHIIPHDLVVTGGKAWKEKGIYQKIEELQLEERVHILGFVPDDEMPALYQAADAYIYPSLYEGFGIPLIEAFASGTPVLCSNTSSLPEIGGDAALYFDPKNTEEMAAQIVALLNSPDLQKEYIQKGYERRKAFSWVESAEKILSMLTKT